MPECRAEDRLADRAPRVLGLLGERRGRLEAGEREHGVDRPGDHPGDAGVVAGVCAVPKTLTVLAEPAFTTNRTPSTTKTRISKTPRIVPSSAEARTPKKPTRPMIAAPSSAHGHHRFAGYLYHSACNVLAVVKPSCNSSRVGTSASTNT